MDPEKEQENQNNEEKLESVLTASQPQIQETEEEKQAEETHQMEETNEGEETTNQEERIASNLQIPSQTPAPQQFDQNFSYDSLISRKMKAYFFLKINFSQASQLSKNGTSSSKEG